ncbi:MAG: GNAT family N-acetyltransferase [Endomicrobium sp.]|jgi:hypothetical protein|nr:GNAT family N-acetyltransferase [Endomicrobium sp.]
MNQELRLEKFDYNLNLSEQRALFKDCFPETDGEAIQGIEHYKWKFHSFPSMNKSWEYAAYIDDEIVGYYAALPYIYRIGSEKVNIGMVCDVMTSSKYRGKGIFTKIGTFSTNELSNNVPFTMGYVIRKEVMPGHLKVGWKVAFKLPLYMKFIRLNSLLNSKHLSFLSPLANIFISLYNFILKGKLYKEYSYNIKDYIDNIEGYEEFTKKWRETVPNALIKDLSFARWRYSAPQRNYKFIEVRDSKKELVAFVAYRKIIKESVPSYGILDYQILPENEKCHAIINRVLELQAKKEGVEAIMTMMSCHSAKKYKLKRYGFLKSPFIFNLIIKNLSNQFSDDILFKESNWHVMWVDSDDL